MMTWWWLQSPAVKPRMSQLWLCLRWTFHLLFLCVGLTGRGSLTVKDFPLTSGTTPTWPRWSFRFVTILSLSLPLIIRIIKGGTSIHQIHPSIYPSIHLHSFLVVEYWVLAVQHKSLIYYSWPWCNWSCLWSPTSGRTSGRNCPQFLCPSVPRYWFTVLTWVWGRAEPCRDWLTLLRPSHQLPGVKSDLLLKAKKQSSFHFPGNPSSRKHLDCTTKQFLSHIAWLFPSTVCFCDVWYLAGAMTKYFTRLHTIKARPLKKKTHRNIFLCFPVSWWRGLCVAAQTTRIAQRNVFAWRHFFKT